MPQKEISYIDANILIDYLDPDIDRDRKKVINKFFTRRNIGNREIRIFTIALGEVFKRIIEKQFYNKNLDTKLAKIKEQLIFVKFDYSNFKKILEHFNRIDKLDDRIQKADKFNLAAFCSDNEARIYYTNDSDILNSTRLFDYLKGLRKIVKLP